MTTITQTEKTELAQLEAVIERTQQSAQEFAVAVHTIREKKLWRGMYDSWEDYCILKWGWGKRRGDQHAVFGEVLKSLEINENMGTDVPTEAAARELGRVPASDRADVLQRAVESGAVTAPSIEAAADEWRPGLTQTVQIDKIGRIWERFKDLEGKPETVLVASVNLLRETGLHLQGLAGHERLSAGKFLKFKDLLPGDMEFDKAKNCVRLAHKFKSKATLQECGSEAETVMQVRGAVKVKHRDGKQQSHTETPFVTVAGLLGDVRVGLEKVFAGKAEWAKGMKESIVVEIHRQEKYLKEAREKL